MSNPYRITPRAKQDLQNIARYTLETWGRKQRNRYLYSLEQRFSWLAEDPQRGGHRPDIKLEYFCYPQGSHVIFYLPRDDGIDIIGIHHQRMDVMNYFFG